MHGPKTSLNTPFQMIKAALKDIDSDHIESKSKAFPDPKRFQTSHLPSKILGHASVSRIPAHCRAKRQQLD